jgi:hypothetical protein
LNAFRLATFVAFMDDSFGRDRRSERGTARAAQPEL